MMPRPSRSVRIISSSLSAGSPKNLAPPWFSSTRSWRCTEPTVAVAMLPYFAPTSFAFLDRYDRSSRRSLRSTKPLFSASLDPNSSSAKRNAMLMMPSCTSLRASIREISSGPISKTVVRTGWPCSPNRSQNTTGNSSVLYLKPTSVARLTRKSLASPGSAMPDRSPLISAANTGTPAREKPSARTWSVTVFPVPVAPVTRPCRFANLRVRYSDFLLLPTKILSSRNTSAITSPVDCANYSQSACNEYSVGQAGYSSRLFKHPHLTLCAGFHLCERPYVPERLSKNIAGTCQPRLISLADRRASEAERDRRSFRPIGDFAGCNDGARVSFTSHFDRHVEVDLLTPCQRRRGDRQRRGDSL